MLGRLFTLPFGTVWKLKTFCYRNRRGLFAKLARLVYQTYQYENNSSVAWNSTFAGEPCFPHGMKSVFVSGDACVGRNCVIFQQVTIGSITLSDSAGAGAPKIGDSVYIGAGAKIVGNVTVGDNVRIGANAVVYQDVPDNSVVVGGEQRIISRTSIMDNRYYSSIGGRAMYFEDGSWKPAEAKRQQ